MLSDWLLLFTLVMVFIVYSIWALRKRVYLGYVLGWMLGLLVVISYSTVASDTIQIMGRPPEGAERSISLLPVVISILCGFLTAAVGVGLTILTDSQDRRDSLKFAIYTAVGVILIFAMLVSTTLLRHLIAIYALSLAVTALTATLFTRTERPYVQPPEDSRRMVGDMYQTYVPEEPPPPVRPANRPSEAIRQFQQRLRERSGQYRPPPGYR